MFCCCLIISICAINQATNLISYLVALKFNRKKICCSCDSLWPLMLRSASTNSPLSFNRGKPTSDSLRQWTSMHGTCTQLLPDLYQITTCDGHCWHCVESRGYPGRIKTALAAVYYQQSPALASWPTKHTGEADRGKKKTLGPRSDRGRAWWCLLPPVLIQMVYKLLPLFYRVTFRINLLLTWHQNLD